MKKISFANDFLEIKSIFDGLRTGKEDVVLWQKSSSDTRLVRYALIEKNLFVQKEIWLKSKTGSEFAFTIGTIYCFIDSLNVVFKTSVNEQQKELIAILYPDEITLLDEADPMKNDMIFIRGHGEGNIQDIIRVKGGSGSSNQSNYMTYRSLSNSTDLFEDESKYLAMRESQRVQPKEQKFVTIIREGQIESDTIRLLDLSQGGAGLLVFNQDEFKLKEIVIITAIDGKPIDKVLRGEVVAIRPYSSDLTDYKVGIKFSS
ncbi:MAG: hypothetical protein ACOYL6_11615 [Bacteriovoracaceae bacterium]